MSRSTAGNGGDPMIGPAVVYDQYIPRSGGAAAADAGAGAVAGPSQSSD